MSFRPARQHKILSFKKNEEFSTAAANALLPLSLFDDEGKTDAGAEEVAKRERKSVEHKEENKSASLNPLCEI